VCVPISPFLPSPFLPSPCSHVVVLFDEEKMQSCRYKICSVNDSDRGESIPVHCSNGKCDQKNAFIHKACLESWERKCRSEHRRRIRREAPPCHCGIGHLNWSRINETSQSGKSPSERQLSFFHDAQVRRTGSIFEHRQDLNGLCSLLPVEKRNAFHVKIEDDCPQGGDDVRIFILKALGSENCRSVDCILWSSRLIVYDRYPLIDGVFFVSPVKHGSGALPVRFDGRNGHLQSICARCLSREWRCRRCLRDDWFLGKVLVIGGLYTFDVLSTSICCPPTCRVCQSPVLTVESQRLSVEKGNFLLFCESTPCSACGHRDAHYIRRADTIQMIGQL